MKIYIEIYDTEIDTWAQGKYLVHGFNEVFWSNALEDVFTFLKKQLEDADINDADKNKNI